MRNERFYKCAPRPPLCPSCAQIMRLARITSRFGDLPELYTFECRACGASHIEAAYFEVSMNTTILIMLVAIVVATSVAWHGRGRWY